MMLLFAMNYITILFTIKYSEFRHNYKSALRDITSECEFPICIDKHKIHIYLLRTVEPVNVKTTTFTVGFVDPGIHETFRMQNIA
jgi:hypothetical protein